MSMGYRSVMSATGYPNILRLVNYSWAKVQSTNYLKNINIDINLNFDSLSFDEDIPLYCQILIQSKRVRMVDISLCILELADSILEPIFRNALHKRSKIIFSDINCSYLLKYRHSKPSCYSLIQKILA